MLCAVIAHSPFDMGGGYRYSATVHKSISLLRGLQMSKFYRPTGRIILKGESALTEVELSEGDDYTADDLLNAVQTELRKCDIHNGACGYGYFTGEDEIHYRVSIVAMRMRKAEVI